MASEKGLLRKRYWELCVEVDNAWRDYRKLKTGESFERYLQVKKMLDENIEAIFADENKEKNA